MEVKCTKKELEYGEPAWDESITNNAFPSWLRTVVRTVVRTVPDSKVYGANVGPTWGRQDPDGPHVGPLKFAI